MMSAVSSAPQSLLRKLVVNLGWLGLQKALVILLGIAATGLVARHLGPQQAGLLAGAQALAVLFGIASMGVDATVFTRRLRTSPELAPSLLGGTACVLAFTGIASWLLLVAYLLWIDHGPVTLRWAAAVIGLRMWLTFPAPLAMWFQSRMETREVVLPNTAGTLVFRLWQALGGLAGWGVIRIALAEFLSLLTISVLCIRAFVRKGGSIRHLRADWRCGWSVLVESFPALVAACLGTFMSRIDVIMLRAIKGETEIGYFTAASSITESLMFISGMLVTVFSPVLVQSFNDDSAAYEKQSAGYTRLTVCLGWGMAAVVSLASVFVISTVFGSAYQPAAAVLSVHAFMLVPGMLGSASQCQLTIERRLHWLVLVLLVALAADVLLNAWLIPAYGARGAAAASVGASILAYTVVPSLIPATRRIGLRAIHALLLPLPRRADVASFAGASRF